MPDIITVAELGITEDPGTDWHPRPGHEEAWDEDGNLANLSEAQVAQHLDKPEAATQVDAGVPPMAAEDSAESPEDQV